MQKYTKTDGWVKNSQLEEGKQDSCSDCVGNAMNDGTNLNPKVISDNLIKVYSHQPVADSFSGSSITSAQNARRHPWLKSSAD